MSRTQHQNIAAIDRSQAVEQQHARIFAVWALVPLFSGGFLACVPFAVAARRTGQRKFRVAAAAWLALTIVTVVLLAIGGQGHGPLTVIAGFLVLLNMGGGAVHTLAIRGEVAHELSLGEDPSLVAAERHADLRARARELAERDPARALELGVGRPDLKDAFAGGLIDVNHAPPAVLAGLPGIDPGLAQRIVELRMNGTGFQSAEDLDMVLDLDPGTLRELAAQAVFLPRD
jgi:hypothetical protein